MCHRVATFGHNPAAKCCEAYFCFRRAFFAVTSVTALAVPEAMVDQPERRLIMPTDLGAVSARKRKAQALTQTDITIVSVCVIICLVNLVLLFVDQSFAEAIELMGLF